MTTPRTLRASAALLAAGAYDATPLEVPCGGSRTAVLWVEYTEDGGATDGGPACRVEVSCDEGATWHAPGVAEVPVAGVADVTAPITHAFPVGTGAYALPVVVTHATHLRVAFAELGDVAFPGVLAARVTQS